AFAMPRSWPLIAQAACGVRALALSLATVSARSFSSSMMSSQSSSGCGGAAGSAAACSAPAAAKAAASRNFRVVKFRGGKGTSTIKKRPPRIAFLRSIVSRSLAQNKNFSAILSVVVWSKRHREGRRPIPPPADDPADDAARVSYAAVVSFIIRQRRAARHAVGVAERLLHLMVIVPLPDHELDRLCRGRERRPPCRQLTPFPSSPSPRPPAP